MDPPREGSTPPSSRAWPAWPEAGGLRQLQPRDDGPRPRAPDPERLPRRGLHAGGYVPPQHTLRSGRVAGSCKIKEVGRSTVREAVKLLVSRNVLETRRKVPAGHPPGFRPHRRGLTLCPNINQKTARPRSDMLRGLLSFFMEKNHAFPGCCGSSASAVTTMKRTVVCFP